MLTHIEYYFAGEPDRILSKGGILYELGQKSRIWNRELEDRQYAHRKRFNRWPY